MSLGQRPIGEATRYIRGVTFKPGDVVPFGTSGSCVCLRTKNIQEDLDQSDLLAIPAKLVARQDQWLREGDVLLSSANSWNLVGKCVQVPELPYAAAAGGFIAAIRPIPSVVDSRYLYRWLSSPTTQAAIRGCARQTTNIANLSVPRFLALPMPLPPLAEQRRIAAILDKADAIRRKRQQAIQLTDDLVRSAFLSLVGPGHRDYSTWPVMTVEDLAAKHDGAIRTGPFGSDLHHSEFVDSGIAVLGIDNAVNNRFEWAQRRFITEEKFRKLERYRVFPGDVIVTIMGTTGRSAVVPDNIPTAISTKHLTTITPDLTVVRPEFLSNAIHRHPAILRQIRGADRGAIMPGLNLTILKGLKLALPPFEQQTAFSTLVASTRALQSRLQVHLGASTDLFATLVQRAFRGDDPHRDRKRSQ